MSDFELANRPFSFRLRPSPVPGDLRIAWRVALVLIMLGRSRSNRASLAKLHILNDAVRSNQQDYLITRLTSARFDLPWDFRVEPAFGRAIDFVVGEKLATWTKATGRAALQLTKAGLHAMEAVMGLDDALVAERAIILELSKMITEATVASLLGEGRRA